MLASLGRCCWKQARPGKGPPDAQQKGIAGNTILFSRPTANVPSMELPPAHDALWILSTPCSRERRTIPPRRTGRRSSARSDRTASGSAPRSLRCPSGRASRRRGCWKMAYLLPVDGVDRAPTLLLSTSDVPGIEGRKTTLRFDGHANNLKSGAAIFFAIPNFADTYSPLVLQLHEGPHKNIHMDRPVVQLPATRTSQRRARPLSRACTGAWPWTRSCRPGTSR